MSDREAQISELCRLLCCDRETLKSHLESSHGMVSSQLKWLSLIYIYRMHLLSLSLSSPYDTKHIRCLCLSSPSSQRWLLFRSREPCRYISIIAMTYMSMHVSDVSRCPRRISRSSSTMSALAAVRQQQLRPFIPSSRTTNGNTSHGGSCAVDGGGSAAGGGGDIDLDDYDDSEFEPASKRPFSER